MKLVNMNDDVYQNGIHVQDLHDLLSQPAYAELRPCVGCDKPCPCSNSRICTCLCGPDCAHAPIAMSSDADRYPIESKIVPLVFGINCLRVCRPYWSCEGHQFKSDRVVRVPQVWFYTRSLMYPKLIAEHLARLVARKAIHNSWQICVTYTDENLEAGFSIKPDMNSIKEPCLETMQRDANIIAESLVAGVRMIASEYLRRHESRVARSAAKENANQVHS